MAAADLKTKLHELDLLSGISDNHLEKIAELACFTDFPEGAIIFRENEIARRFYVILDGRVSLEICAPGVGCTHLQTIGAGALLGWGALLRNRQLTATARAMTAVRAIELDGCEIAKYCESNPAVGSQIMRHTAMALGNRLTATRKRLLEACRTEATALDESE